MRRIGVVGMGYVGLTFSIVAAKKGFTVSGIEKDKNILKVLESGEAHFFEQGINSALKKFLNRNIFISDSFKSLGRQDVFIITVGTPLINKDAGPDIQHIVEALKSISNVFTGKELVILRSTVSVGVTREYVIPHLSKISGINKNDLKVAFCPERTVEGNALQELVHLPQIIGANNSEAMKLAERLFSKLTSTTLNVESIEAAELIKLLNNTYRDVHFSIGNYFNEIAQSFGINGLELIKAANYKYPRSRIAMPGFVGGPCLEKDPYILTHNLKKSKGKEFVLDARKYNESLEDSVVNWAKKITTNLKIKKIGITGLAFKGKPDTSDLRGSNGVSIVKSLKNLGFEVVLHDFIASQAEVSALGKPYSDLYEMINGLPLLMILNNNRRYQSLDLEIIETGMKTPKIILDCWNCIDSETSDTNLNILNIGDLFLDRRV
jgi:nucleotide sugar dehydrogenase|tara:strand:+ start:1019 stop:2326 length:1308 start_codon:yes stop_codon:yes gene_type:complete